MEQCQEFKWPRFITLTTKESKTLVHALMDGKTVAVWNSKDAIKILELMHRVYGYLCQITDVEEYLEIKVVSLLPWRR